MKSCFVEVEGSNPRPRNYLKAFYKFSAEPSPAQMRFLLFNPFYRKLSQTDGSAI